jgi:hypothetical protein
MNATYHKKEITIAGQTITAEYFETNINFPDTQQSKLCVFWDTISLPFYRFKHKVKHIYWEIRYAIQRALKGYDDVDTFSLDSKFIDRYYKILTEFKKNLHGHPSCMTEDEWYRILDDMLLHLYYMDEENVDKELSTGVPKNWLPTMRTSMEIMEHHKTEFFGLFSEHFYDLWD